MSSKSKVCFNLRFKKVNIIKSDCSICYEEVENTNIIQTNCNHTYCISCFKKYLTIKSETFHNKITCPYCRQHIHCISLNNDDELQSIKNEFCNIYKYMNIFEPVSVYVYQDIYNVVFTGEFNLHEDVPDIIIVYPIVVYTLLFIYMCVTLDYLIMIKFAIIAKLWYLFYKILSFYNIIDIEHYCLISLIALCFFGIYTIIY
jgi:hypothetical protein